MPISATMVPIYGLARQLGLRVGKIIVDRCLAEARELGLQTQALPGTRH